MRRLWNSKPTLWVLLAIPAALYIYRFFSSDIWPGDLLHPTGEMSARLIIVALSLTPLSIAFGRRRWVQWLIRRRRSFGVAAFGYALLHLIFYVLDMETVKNILAEVGATGIWTGWLAFFLLLPLALTSNEASVRALKGGWKRLQRLAYPAAVLTLAHWLFIHDGSFVAVVHFAPLALLELYRLIIFARARSTRGDPSVLPDHRSSGE